MGTKGTETIEQFKQRGGVVKKLEPGPEPKVSPSEITHVREPMPPKRFEDMPDFEPVSGQRAGLFNIDKHHVFPQENRPWFERRGMKGADNIDNFTVELDKAIHQAQHGGGDWKLARKVWQDEYNKLVMHELKNAEAAKRIMLGNREALLTPEEIKAIVYKTMDQRQIPRKFVKY